VSNAEARMTFTEHLGELRARIIRAGIAVIVSVIACYVFSNQIFELLKKPLQTIEQAKQTAENGGLPGAQTQRDAANPAEQRAAKGPPQWVNLTPLEWVLVKFKLAGYGGITISFPIILYQICAFVFPGLTQQEKKAARILIVGCGSLFVAGVLVAYFGVLRLVVPYLLEWTPPDVVNQFRTSETIAIIIKFLLAFAVAFQFPMVVLILVYMGLLTPAALKRFRRVAIVVMAVLAAMFTPPDPGTMIIMLAPLLILYEASIWISYLVVRHKGKAASA